MRNTFFTAIQIVLLMISNLSSQTPGIRIYGGTPVQEGEYPWVVSLKEANNPDGYSGHFCGGSLISPSWVLSAEHCVQGLNAADIEIVIGTVDLNDLSNADVIPVSEIFSIWDQYTYSDNEQVNGVMPNNYQLMNVFPNPFNPVTTIRYELPESGEVIISVYDMLGQEVVEIVNSVQEAGYYTITWDATNYASGAYVVKMTTGDFTQTQKMLLLK